MSDFMTHETWTTIPKEKGTCLQTEVNKNKQGKNLSQGQPSKQQEPKIETKSPMFVLTSLLKGVCAAGQCQRWRGGSAGVGREGKAQASGRLVPLYLKPVGGGSFVTSQLIVETSGLAKAQMVTLKKSRCLHQFSRWEIHL